MNLFAVEVHMKILRGHHFVQIFVVFWQEEILDQVISEKYYNQAIHTKQQHQIY